MTTGALVIGTVGATAAAIGLLLRRRYLVVAVRGDSMLPALHDGDVLLARRRRPRDIRVGDVAVASWPAIVAAEESPRWMVKRVAAVAGDPVPDCVRHAAEAVPAEVAVAVAGAAAAPEVVPSGFFIVLGDNGGYDSRVFGLLPGELVLAVVVRRLPVGRH